MSKKGKPKSELLKISALDKGISFKDSGIFINRLNEDIAGITLSGSNLISNIALDELKISPIADIKAAAAKLFNPGFAHDEKAKLLSEINRLREEQKKLGLQLADSKASKAQLIATITEMQATSDALQQKHKLAFLVEKVCSEAGGVLLTNEEFQQKFLSRSNCAAYVMSIDVRRSTELMLKARTAEGFADFIAELCFELASVVKESFGVVDKFTGDGVLAVFPLFFTGRDAAFRVVDAADRCHSAFKRHYHKSRSLFSSVLKDVGLGIGIDFGDVTLVQMLGGLTSVGEPVVYACRLSGAPADTTLVNQPAYEQIDTQLRLYCNIEETELNVKHEGPTIAYKVRLRSSSYKPALPPWHPDSDNTA